jgi:Zn-dependent protease with chaperone function
MMSSFIFIATLVLFALALPVRVFADTLCPPGQFTALCNLKAENLGSAVGNFVTILLILAIILSLIFLVYGGIKWITSGGDKQKIDSARSHIVAAIVGLVLSLLAYFILNIITYLFTGQTFSTFTIPKLF